MPETDHTILKFCIICLLAAYCSKECQTADWKLFHKGNCVPKSQRVSLSGTEEIREEDINKPKCVICQGIMIQDDSVILNCLHMFHKCCFQQLKNHSSKTSTITMCPLCRADSKPKECQQDEVENKTF